MVGLLLIGLAWFGVVALVPVWQVRTAVAALREGRSGLEDQIAKLGGQQYAAHKIVRYLNFPRHTAQDRALAIDLLGSCGGHGKAAAPLLTQSLDGREDVGGDGAVVRISAAAALGRITPPPDIAVPALVRATKDPCAMVRLNAIRSLGQIGPSAGESVPLLIDIIKGAAVGDLSKTPFSDPGLASAILAIDALGRIAPGDIEAIKVLESLTSNPVLGATAQSALARVKRPEAVHRE
jgi:HEAT repeat protein